MGAPCTCRGCRFLRHPLLYLFGVIFAVLATWGEIRQLNDSGYTPVRMLGLLVLVGFLVAQPRGLWLASDRWRKPRFYASLLAALLIAASIASALYGEFVAEPRKDRAERPIIYFEDEAK